VEGAGGRSALITPGAGGVEDGVGEGGVARGFGSDEPGVDVTA
jgi:hypothetical protein